MEGVAFGQVMINSQRFCMARNRTLHYYENNL